MEEGQKGIESHAMLGGDAESRCIEWVPVPFAKSKPTFGCLSLARGHDSSLDRATMMKAWMINSLMGSVGLYVLGVGAPLSSID